MRVSHPPSYAVRRLRQVSLSLLLPPLIPQQDANITALPGSRETDSRRRGSAGATTNALGTTVRTAPTCEGVISLDALDQIAAALPRLLAKMPFLRGSDFKVAFYLVTRVIATASPEVSISERALSDATGMSLSTIFSAIRRLEHSGLFLREVGGRARADRYLLPAFRPAEAVSKTDTPAPEIGTPGAPEIGTRVPLESIQGVPEIDTPAPEIGTPGAPEIGTGVPENGTAPYKERAPARRNRIVSIGSSSSSIDRYLTPTTFDPSQAEDARLLRGRLRSFCQRVGSEALSGSHIDDKIIGQCLAIAPLDALLACLGELDTGRLGKPKTYAWFVTVFLERIHGYTPVEVAQARQALKHPARKLPRDERADAVFVDGIKQQLGAVKGMK